MRDTRERERSKGKRKFARWPARPSREPSIDCFKIHGRIALVPDLLQGVLEAVLRVLVQSLDAAERDEVGEVGHGEKRGEEKQAKHTPRKGYRKSFKEEKWIIFSRPLLSLSLLSSKLLHTQAKGRGLLLPLALLPSPRLHARPKDEESIINRGRGQEVISRRRCSRIQFFLQSSTSFYLFSLALPSSPPFLPPFPAAPPT